MTSLADELMNDLDSGSEQGDEYELENGQDVVQNGRASKGDGEDDDEDDDMDDGDAGPGFGGAEGDGEDMHVPEGGVKPTLELDPDAVNDMALGAVTQVGKVAKLAHSGTLKDVLKVGSVERALSPRLDSSHSRPRLLFSVSTSTVNTPIQTWQQTATVRNTS